MTHGRDLDLDLSEQEQKVLSALAELEAADQPTFVPEVARAAGLGEDDVREALTALTGRHNLVSEVANQPPGDTDNVDLGPQYLLRQPG